MKLDIDVKKVWDGNKFKVKIIPKIKHNTVREAALFCQGQAILLTPVDSGRLRGSLSVKMQREKNIKNPNSAKAKLEDFIKDEPKKDEAHVGTNVDYADYVEFGTAKSAAQPYLRPAADLTEGKSITIIERAGKTEFEGYDGIK